MPYPDAPDRWACVLSISRYPSDPWTSWEQDLTLLLDPPPELHILSSSQENLISVRCCCTHSQEGSHLPSHCLSQVNIQYTCVLTDIFVWFCMFLFFLSWLCSCETPLLSGRLVGCCSRDYRVSYCANVPQLTQFYCCGYLHLQYFNLYALWYCKHQVDIYW